MLRINYYIHIILNSKYKKLIEYLLILIIYVSCLEGHYISCMNNDLVPEIAEPKVPVIRGIQPLTPLQFEVSKFLGYDDIIKQQETIIGEQKEDILRLRRQLTIELAEDRDRIRRALPFLHNGTIDRVQDALNSYQIQNNVVQSIFEETGIQRIVSTNGTTRIVLTPEDWDRINNNLREQQNRIRRLTIDNDMTSSLSWWLFGVAFLGYYSAWAFYGINPVKLFLGPIKW